MSVATALETAEPGTPIPEVRGLPLLGNAHRLLRDPGPFLLDAYRELGPVFRVRLFGMEMVALIGPDANREILVNQRLKFSNAEGYRIVTDLMGDGVLFQDGAVHKRNRKLMTPAFNHEGVARYFEVMHRASAEHAERWAREGHGSMLTRFRELTFEIMARLILGVRGTVELEHLSRLNVALGRGLTAFPRWNLPFLPYGRGLRARDELRGYLRGVVRSRREGEESEEGVVDALGLLVAARDEDGDALTEDDLLEQAVILMFAGHETTTSMLTSWLLCLRDHPEIGDRLLEEQREVVGDDELGPGHLERLIFLDAVLKEVERLHPPINLLNRGVVEEAEIEGHRLAPGTLIAYSPWVTHRIPEVFADPGRFDPDRFLPPRKEHRATPYSLIGFGGGPRLCLGQPFAILEMKIVASILLRRYTWELDPGDPKLVLIPTLHPRSGLPGTIRPIARA